MKEVNKMELKFRALSQNESFARASVAGFCMSLNPTMDELTDIKTAVSEAVTNCIVHAYREAPGSITLAMALFSDRSVRVEVIDHGCGIADIKQAREPMFTTGGAERSGMGFTIMESFMDKLTVRSVMGRGTTVIMKKKLAPRLKKPQ